MSEVVISSAVIAGGAAILGAFVGGTATYLAAIKGLKMNSQAVESTEIRRQKVECVINLSGLKWVLGSYQLVPDEFKARFLFELNRISVLWSNDRDAMKSLRDFFVDRTNERLVSLVRSLCASISLPAEALSDAEIQNTFYFPMTGR
jgi:hypothetical protein